MAGSEQYGIEVLILLQVFLVEGQLPVARVRDAQTSNGREALRAEIGTHMLDPPESVSSSLRPETHSLGGVQEVGLDIAGHESPFLAQIA